MDNNQTGVREKDNARNTRRLSSSNRGVDIDIILRCLPPSLRKHLLSKGFHTDADIMGMQPLELAAEAGISHDDALMVLKEISTNSRQQMVGARIMSARDIFEKERTQKSIVTFSMELDKLLGGGIRTGQITEFCGAPGVGKTQIAMQLAVNVQIPSSFNGLEGEAIYIDTEGSFAPKRCLHMASAFCQHLEKVAVFRNDSTKLSDTKNLNPQKILDQIHYFRVRNSTEQLAVVELLESFLDAHPNVKIIILDSVAFHFRHDFEDMGLRTRRLSQMAKTLMDLAHSKNIAIVMMNHVTTKILGDGKSKLVPALGDSWAHAATNRILCYLRDSKRFAFLFKSPYLPSSAAEYRVTKDGIRGSTGKSSGTKRPHA